MVADYPLRITDSGDERIRKTLEHIVANCFFKGGFFQDMIHSGVNAYLTLSLAQTMLRVGDERFSDLVDTVAELASPTGNWPEAVHPFTGGGCMGDGQHGWAAAEWVMLVRNLFVREEEGLLVFGSGLLPRWVGEEAFFGPTATPYGTVSLRLQRQSRGIAARIDALWNGKAPLMRIAVPGYRAVDGASADETIELEPL
jgi:hypothetical protein